ERRRRGVARQTRVEIEPDVAAASADGPRHRAAVRQLASCELLDQGKRYGVDPQVGATHGESPGAQHRVDRAGYARVAGRRIEIGQCDRRALGVDRIDGEAEGCGTVLRNPFRGKEADIGEPYVECAAGRAHAVSGQVVRPDTIQLRELCVLDGRSRNVERDTVVDDAQLRIIARERDACVALVIDEHECGGEPCDLQIGITQAWTCETHAWRSRVHVLEDHGAVRQSHVDARVYDAQALYLEPARWPAGGVRPENLLEDTLVVPWNVIACLREQDIGSLEHDVTQDDGAAPERVCVEQPRDCRCTCPLAAPWLQPAYIACADAQRPLE